MTTKATAPIAPLADLNESIGSIDEMQSSALDRLDIAELARQIAARLAPDTLLDARDVAAMLKCQPRYVTEQMSRAPGFPRAIRIAGPNGRRSNPRWQRSDIMEWIESQKTPPRRVGRPRSNR